MATMDGIERMPIKATRALWNAALDGSLNDAEFRKDPNFGLEFPVAVPGVDSAILDPRNAWADKAAYDRTAQPLVQQFIATFAEFEEHVDARVRQAAPPAAVAAYLTRNASGCSITRKERTHASRTNRQNALRGN